MLHNSKLEAKVAVVNNVNNYANSLYDFLSEIFKEYVGQKIFKADGQLLAKIAAKLPELPNKDALRAYFHTSNYSLVFNVCGCEHYKRDDGYSSNESYDIGVYIGEISNGVLTQLCQCPNHRSDYSAETIKNQREVCEKAKKDYESAKSELFPFGEG